VDTPASRSSRRTSSATLADLLDVRIARSEEELSAALDLRERVFCGEQGVSRAADRDGRDPEATHIVAVDGGRVLGTCRLLFRGATARLGRLAVEPEARGRGIAGAVLGEATRVARSAAAERIALHAQTYAMGLYVHDGYEVAGEPFEEEGIEHVAMEKPLA
jgi:predicted GNAT family N-acyltransferase